MICASEQRSLLCCSATGRATYAIDKTLIQGQRVVTAFGGMKTSEARAKGLAGLARPMDTLRPVDASPPAPSSIEQDGKKLGMVDGTDYDNAVVEPGPMMQDFWGPPPTQHQYDEARRSASGAQDWQENFETNWIEQSEQLVKKAEENRVANRGKQAMQRSSGRIRAVSRLRAF